MTHTERIERCLEKAERRAFKENDWGKRHVAAWKSAAHPMPLMIKGWAIYADWHQARYESPIGEDYILGPAWTKIGQSLLTLLNGDLGALDGGTLDGLIRDCLQAEGWEG